MDRFLYIYTSEIGANHFDHHLSFIHSQLYMHLDCQLTINNNKLYLRNKKRQERGERERVVNCMMQIQRAESWQRVYVVVISSPN